MIDLQAHILPGLDSEAPDLESSIAIARAAVADGVTRLVATPYVRAGPGLDSAAIQYAVGALNVALARAEIPLVALPGALVELAAAAAFDRARLRALSLGLSGCVLVEAPRAGDADSVERVLDGVQRHGLRVLLAQPERSASFQADPAAVAAIVEHGVLCCVGAGSLAGRFGEPARSTAIALLRAGQVHVVASGVRGAGERRTGLREAFAAVERELPWLGASVSYFSERAPAAILSAKPLPPPPTEADARPRRRRFARFLRRR